MAGWPPKKNAAFTWYFFIRDADGDPVTSAADLDVEYSGDGGAFSDVAGTETEEGEGLYSCVIAQAEMNYDVVALVCKTSTSGAKTAAQVVYTSAAQIDDLVDDIWDEALSGHQTQGTAGAALTMAAYAGPHGPGVYIDDAAANTGTTLGDDGTLENPVSTIAAATTIAEALGVKRFYLTNDSAITLAQTYEDYEFMGIGMNNQVTLGSQDVDNSVFRLVILTGTQGGTGLMYAVDCWLQSLASAQLFAHNCWLTGNNTLRAATNHIFDACKSAVAGDSTPEITLPGSGTTNLQFRHYSGGLQINSATSNDTLSFESDGQLIIDATCTNLTVTVRGNCTITDNGTTTSLTQDGAVTRTNINAEVDSALDTAIPASPTADSVNERIKSLDEGTSPTPKADFELR